MSSTRAFIRKSNGRLCKPSMMRSALPAVLLAYELPDGRLKLIDGHLRQDMTPDMEVDVEVLDVDDAEARALLLSIDPLVQTGRVSTTRPSMSCCGLTQTDNAMLQAFWANLQSKDREAQDDLERKTKDDDPLGSISGAGGVRQRGGANDAAPAFHGGRTQVPGPRGLRHEGPRAQEASFPRSAWERTPHRSAVPPDAQTESQPATPHAPIRELPGVWGTPRSGGGAVPTRSVGTRMSRMSSMFSHFTRQNSHENPRTIAHPGDAARAAGVRHVRSAAGQVVVA